MRTHALRPTLPGVRRSRFRLGLLGAVLLIALHVFMVETTGTHVHQPPVPSPDHPSAAAAAHGDIEVDAHGMDLITWTEAEERDGAALACLAVLVGLTLLQRVLRGRIADAAVPAMALRSASGPAPRTPPPVSRGILRV